MKKFYFIIFILFIFNLFGCSSTKYTISFNSNGGSTVDSIVQSYNTTVKKPSDPTKEGHIFAGWYSDKVLYSEYIFTTMPEENITLYAKWELPSIDVFLLDNGKEYGVKIKESEKDTVENITIVSIFNNKPVTKIFDRGFMDCINLKSVIIPEGITSIGTNAFADCTSLTSITIPKSVTSIGSEAFRGCSSLVSITLPFVGASRTATMQYNYSPQCFGYIFGSDSYADSYKADDFYIPNSLKEVVITDTPRIGSNAFFGCNNLTSITIPDTVTTIENSAFYGIDSLTTITIPNSVTSIGPYTFRMCTSLTSIIISESVTSISGEMFYNCTSLTSITIPESVTTISISAFNGCSSLTSIKLPESVTSIESSAFRNCTSLTSIIIPKNVTYLDSSAFSNCASITFYCEISSQPDTWGPNWNYPSRPVVWGYVPE